MWFFLLMGVSITSSGLSFQGEFPSVEDMTVAERALHEMRALIRLMQEELANAQEKKKKEQEQEEERRKQAELQAQQEAQKAAAQSAKAKAQKKGESLVQGFCHRSAQKKLKMIPPRCQEIKICAVALEHNTT